MLHFHRTPLALALLTALTLGQQVAWAEGNAQLREEVTTQPGRVITPADEQVLSNSASRVLHHLAKAREQLRRNDADAAKQELAQAQTLLDLLHDNLPTTLVKTQVWGQDGQLKYSSTEEVPAAEVPIVATLDERADFGLAKALPPATAADPAQQAHIDAPAPELPPAQRNALATPPSATPGGGANVQSAGAEVQSADADVQPTTPNAPDNADAVALDKGPEPEAKSVPVALEAADAALYYQELDLPLNLTQRFVTAAKAALDQGQNDQAIDQLSGALDAVHMVSAYLPAPLLAARINLEQAQREYAAGDLTRAKANLDQAIEQIQLANAHGAVPAADDALLNQAQALRARIEGGDSASVGAELRSLWHRVATEAERAVAYTQFGWAKLRHHDPLHQALIEARRYVSLARIDESAKPAAAAKVHEELNQAKVWLDKAATAAVDDPHGAESATLESIRARLNGLLQANDQPDPQSLGQLKQQLNEAIART